MNNRKVTFKVSANTSSNVTWRTTSESPSTTNPMSGDIASSGETTVTAGENVIGDFLKIRIVNDNNDAFVTFTLRNK